MDELSINDTDLEDGGSQIDATEPPVFLDLPDDSMFDAELIEMLEIDSGATDLPQGYDTGDTSDIQNISDWISDINPNFDATADNIDYNFQMDALTGMEQVSMSPEEIEATLLEAGNGSHAIIGIDRSEGPGHWFNAACIDGKVVAIDGQTGEISDWQPDYGDVVNWEKSMWRN